MNNGNWNSKFDRIWIDEFQNPKSNLGSFPVNQLISRKTGFGKQTLET
jgi:hypothetical protein